MALNAALHFVRLRFLDRPAAGALLLAALVLAVSAGVSAEAASGAIDVRVGGATVIRLSHPAKRVIVGDPSVADVSVESPRVLIVFGKQTGGTSLSVMDGDGNFLVDVPVVVGVSGDRAVSVTFAGGKQAKNGGVSQTYLCGAVTCEKVADAVADKGGGNGK